MKKTIFTLTYSFVVLAICLLLQEQGDYLSHKYANRSYVQNYEIDNYIWELLPE